MNPTTVRRPWENDDAAMFRDSLRAFLQGEATPRDPQWRAQKLVDRDFWRQTGELGVLCPSVPVEYGGAGGDFTFEAVMTEELGYASLTSFQQGIHGGIVAHYLLAFGTEEQKQRWLQPMCTGEKIAAIGMTEPGGGSDLQSLRTTARRDGENYIVNGAKTFITNGQNADLAVLAVKTDASAGAKGVTLLVVETRDAKGNDVAGFRRGRNLHKIGMHGSDTAELFFDDLVVPVANRLGEEGAGFTYMMQQLPQERLMIAVGAQAMMEQAIALTIDYVKQRHAFKQPLSNLQNTRFKLAECQAAAQVSRAFVDDCVARHARGELSAVDASMAKFWCTDKLCQVVDECVQLHGGYGYMEEYPIARMYADVRVQRIYGGANEIMKELIARSLFK